MKVTVVVFSNIKLKKNIMVVLFFQDQVEEKHNGCCSFFSNINFTENIMVVVLFFSNINFTENIMVVVFFPRSTLQKT